MRTREMGSYIDQDVKLELTGMCEMCRLDVGSRITSFYEWRQVIGRGVIAVAISMGDRIGGNNNRNNQGRISELISKKLTGLKGEVGKE